MAKASRIGMMPPGRESPIRLEMSEAEARGVAKALEEKGLVEIAAEIRKCLGGTQQPERDSWYDRKTGAATLGDIPGPDMRKKAK